MDLVFVIMLGLFGIMAYTMAMLLKLYAGTIERRLERLEAITDARAYMRVPDEDDEDELYGHAKDIVLESKNASASFLQRKLQIGYARAARLLDQLEEEGIVGPANGAQKREVFIDKKQ